MKRAQPFFAVALALAAFVIVLRHVADPPMMMADFRAFACAGSVALHHDDPYSSAQLAGCEEAPVPRPLFTIEQGAVLPAPIPGYLVAAFLPFALIPFAWSAIAWAMLLCLAIAVAIMFLERLDIGSRWTLLVVLAVPLLAVSVPIGELSPIAMAGVAVLAWAVKERRGLTMSIGLTLTMVEPSVGLCAALAVAVISRRYWLPVAATLLFLFVLSVATIGLHANFEYVRSVLPAHLYAELPSGQQFSLSWIFDRFGASAAVALMAGKLWYILMLVLAAAVARARAPTAPEFAVFAACAFAVLLGPYMHLGQIALALPAALWLCRHEKRPSIAAIAATVALSVPLLPVLGAIPLILVVPPVAGWVAASYSRRPDAGLRAAAIATIAIGLVAYVVSKTEQQQVSVAAPAILNRAQYVRHYNVSAGWSIWLVKFPTWYAAATVAGFAVASTFRKERVRPSD